jgi:hypothetical protein
VVVGRAGGGGRSSSRSSARSGDGMCLRHCGPATAAAARVCNFHDYIY